MTDESPGPAAPAVGPQTRFGFVQLEVPWPLGPPDGRYLLRGPHVEPDAPDGPPTADHVVVIATLAAAERRSRLGRRRGNRSAGPEAEPMTVATGRATVIETRRSLDSEADAQAWLTGAGDAQVEAALATLNHVLRTHRAVAADPRTITLARDHCIAARVGFGFGADLSEGRFSQARELGPTAPDRLRRRRVAPSQARLAAVLAGRRQVLACEELVLRARLDLEEQRPREAALQTVVALDAAVAELTAGPVGPQLSTRLAGLRERRPEVAAVAQAALAADPSAAQLATVRDAIAAVEAALRARTADEN